MGANPFFKKAAAIVLFLVMFFSGYPPNPFVASPAGQGKIVLGSYAPASPSLIPTARAAAKTKTIVFFVGSVVSTTAITSAATTTFNFTISLPDMVPDTQPIRSAYISYNAWQNTVTGITASVFTMNKQGGTAQTLASPTLTGGTTEQQLSIRLNATAAMQNLIGTASGTYAMTFTAKLTGPTLIGSGVELYITYDYDPLALIQMNTVYHSVYSSSTLLGTAAVTSPNFNFNLPESAATTTFAVGASSTNDFWIEYRGFISMSTAVTASVGWNSEATSAVTFAETTQQFSFFFLSTPITTSTSPSSNNTFKMISSVANGIVAPTAIAIATYSYNFASSTKLQKTIQVLLMQSTSTNATATINTTTTINIPETSPSSTDAFLLGRLAFSTSSAPGINAYATTSGCTAPSTTQITAGIAQTKNTGFLTVVWYIAPSSSITNSGNWNICSSFTRSAAANIPGLELFLTYNYANNFSAGTQFDTNLSFLAQSNLSPTGTTFAATGINASIANASATANYSWLDSEFDDNAPGTANQTTTVGIGVVTNSYAFPALNSSARRQGATFSATSSSGFSTVTTTVQCSVACIDDAAYDVFGFTQMIAANFTQVHYNWRNNNGSETGATAAANEDTATDTIAGTIMRLRLEINNAGDATSSAAFRLEYQANGTSSAWTQVATSSVGTAAWQMATSSQVADGTPTTQIATSTGGTDAANIFFLPGEVVASTSRNQTGNYILTGTQFSEDEFAIAATANAATNTPYYFRVSNAGTALTTYSIYPSITVVVSAPTVTNASLNSGSSITLIPNATTSITVIASTTDPGGAGNILYATGTIHRTSLGTNCTANNANCYQIASSSCSFSGSTSTVTCTAGIWYFAQSTGNVSSSFPSDSWTGAISVTNKQGGNTAATSTTQNVNVLTAINVTTSSINYGTLKPNGNTGSTNQTTTVQNVGNSSTSLQLSGTAFVNGGNSIATSSEHYATSTFTFGGSEQQLSGTLSTVSGFTLSGPTSTTSVQNNIFWGDQVPSGTPTGTYTATTTFTSIFSQ